jgi:hypothetical protein
MKHVAAAALMSLVPVLALAQDGPYRPYTFVAPGGVSGHEATLHLGGGIE